MYIQTLIMKCLLNRDLEVTNDFTSESWTPGNSYATDESSPDESSPDESCHDESSDTGLLIAVIVLAVIILLLLVGAGVAYLRYVRSVF
jgi:hypothetical protein